MAQYLRRFSIVWMCLAGLCLGEAAAALTRAEMYQATAPVADRSEAAQTTAFQNAMKIVLIRVTGRRNADEDPALSSLVSNARRYVQQYRAAPDSQLWVAFDGPAIERWLTQNGQPLWGHERPTTLVLLGVQTGAQGGSVVTTDETSDLKSAIDAAAAVRGVPLVWPSAAELQKFHIDYSALSTGSPSTLRGNCPAHGQRWRTRRAGQQRQCERQCALDAFVSGSKQRIFRHLGRRESRRRFIRRNVCRKRCAGAGGYRSQRTQRFARLCRVSRAISNR